MSATIHSKASSFSSSSCQVRRENRFSVVSNRCRIVRCRTARVKCSLSWSSSRSDILGGRISDLSSEVNRSRGNSRVFPVRSRVCPVRSQINGNLRIGNAPKWWEKNLQPNMREVTSAEDLVESLHNAGDKLVVVDFFSPGCGGCRALHPKICQIAEMNPDVQFLQVNYEEHKSMCYSLNVHVLPFFRFYRGAEGRVCSFSCTNATVKKFRDALARYGPDRCSIGPPKGLEEKELLALAANKDLSFNYTPKQVPDKEVSPPALPFSMKTPLLSQEIDKETTVTNSGR